MEKEEFPVLPTFQCLTLIAFAAVSLQVGRKALLLQQQVTCRTVQIDTHKHTTIIKIREKRQVSECCPPCVPATVPACGPQAAGPIIGVAPLQPEATAVACQRPPQQARQRQPPAAPAGTPAADNICLPVPPPRPPNPHPDPAATGSVSSQ